MSRLIRDTTYFSSKKGKLILPEELDDNFNHIGDYINNTLIPQIQSITFIKTNGVAGQTSAVFCNINNNEVGYMYIQDINIDDNLISLNKITKIAAGSVLISDFNGDIYAKTPEDNNQLLLLTDPFLRYLSFRKLRSDDISDNMLTGKQLGILANENFVAGAFNDIIWDDSIYERNLQNISNNKIAPLSVDFKHIGKFTELPYNINLAQQIRLEDFDDNSITPSKISDDSIIPANFNEQQFISQFNLIDGSIVDNHFKPYNANTQPPSVINLPNLIASNFGAIINFPNEGIIVQNVKLPKEKIALNSLGLNSFNQEIRNAINKYKEIKDKALQPPIQVKKTRPDNFVKLGLFLLNPYVRANYENNGSTVKTSYIELGVATYNSGYLIYTAQQNLNGWRLIDNGDMVRFLYYNTKSKLEPLQTGPEYTGILSISSFTGASDAISKYSKRSSIVEFYNFPY